MEIRPFRGWRPSPRPDGSVDGFLAPPYDVLTADDKQRLLGDDGRNIVAVDLPHVPPKEAGPDDVYRRAAEQLAAWQADGTLTREDADALYVYQQRYHWAGQTYARTALLAGVRATPLGEDVIPHEHTFAGPKADRLKLTQHTQMQLSPIFGFYRDPGGQVAGVLAEATGRPPDAYAQLGVVGERLWVLADADAIETIRAALAQVPVFIADGHHRYTTAMNYAADLRETGEIDADHQANFVLFALVGADDPGLLILPTHRLVTGLAEDFSPAQLRERATAFTWRPIDEADLTGGKIDALLAESGPLAMAVLVPGDDGAWIAQLTDPDAMVQAAPDHTNAWRGLDVAVLHELILERALEPWHTEHLAVTYTPDAGEVTAALAEGSAELAVCLQGTRLSQVCEVASAGESMPHKSTYFYPKLATGMVLKPLA